MDCLHAGLRGGSLFEELLRIAGGFSENFTKPLFIRFIYTLFCLKYKYKSGNVTILHPLDILCDFIL